MYDSLTDIWLSILYDYFIFIYILFFLNPNRSKSQPWNFLMKSNAAVFCSFENCRTTKIHLVLCYSKNMKAAHVYEHLTMCKSIVQILLFLLVWFVTGGDFQVPQLTVMFRCCNKIICTHLFQNQFQREWRMLINLLPTILVLTRLLITQ